MQTNITTRFEINLSGNSQDIASGVTFATKNRCPAIIVPPQLVAPAIVGRTKVRGQFKIICTVDFERLGKNYALDKLKTLSPDVFSADGFDILLTPNKTMIESNNEMVAIIDMLKKYNSLAEVRWALCFRNWKSENLDTILAKVSKNPASYIRTDISLNNSVTIEQHISDVERIRRYVPTPIKVGGNVTYEIYKGLEKSVGRFDVTSTQAHNLLVAYKNSRS